MMDLDEAIQSLVDEMGKQAALGHIGHVENLSQMVEWLKELKAYKEQSGDAISRQAVNNMLHIWLEPDDAERMILHLDDIPSVTPQQRTGRWERMSDLPNDVDDRFECSRCGNVVHHRSVIDLRTFSRWCGRCGSDNG